MDSELTTKIGAGESHKIESNFQPIKVVEINSMIGKTLDDRRRALLNKFAIIARERLNRC